ncbi:hypothetical protein FQN49_001265 [Arthroderma sp. PD_2]|nr:hypothetical protein FQN49_001265 [Arthroderma sp. PD_2]
MGSTADADQRIIYITLLTFVEGIKNSEICEGIGRMLNLRDCRHPETNERYVKKILTGSHKPSLNLLGDDVIYPSLSDVISIIQNATPGDGSDAVVSSALGPIYNIRDRVTPTDIPTTDGNGSSAANIPSTNGNSTAAANNPSTNGDDTSMANVRSTIGNGTPEMQDLLVSGTPGRNIPSTRLTENPSALLQQDLVHVFVYEFKSMQDITYFIQEDPEVQEFKRRIRPITSQMMNFTFIDGYYNLRG